MYTVKELVKVQGERESSLPHRLIGEILSFATLADDSALTIWVNSLNRKERDTLLAIFGEEDEDTLGMIIGAYINKWVREVLPDASQRVHDLLVYTVPEEYETDKDAVE